MVTAVKSCFKNMEVFKKFATTLIECHVIFVQLIS